MAAATIPKMIFAALASMPPIVATRRGEVKRFSATTAH